MHDRRIEGKAEVFGNQGALFMRAMTWWDHATGSVWSQPWGLAIDGPLKGTQLKLLPVNLVTWDTWRAEHPNTLALKKDPVFANTGWRFTDDFVVGVALGDSAQAYPFPTLRRQGVVNDVIGPYPIVLHTNAESRSVHVYLRKAGGQTLTFEADGERMRDKETGSLWSPVNGLAVSGPLQGELLQKVPSNSSYEWAWFDFYPHSTLYGE